MTKITPALLEAVNALTRAGHRVAIESSDALLPYAITDLVIGLAMPAEPGRLRYLRVRLRESVTGDWRTFTSLAPESVNEYPTIEALLAAR